VHVEESFMEFISIKITMTWHADKTWGSMISIVHEDFGVFGALQNRLSSGRFRISFKDIDHIIGIGICSSVVNLATLINILAVISWLVEKLTRERIAIVAGNIIIVQMDDVIFRNSLLSQDLISMASVCLMSIVPEGVGTSNDDSPMVFSSR